MSTAVRTQALFGKGAAKKAAPAKKAAKSAAPSKKSGTQKSGGEQPACRLGVRVTMSGSRAHPLRCSPPPATHPHDQAGWAATARTSTWTSGELQRAYPHWPISVPASLGSEQYSRQLCVCEGPMEGWAGRGRVPAPAFAISPHPAAAAVPDRLPSAGMAPTGELDDGTALWGWLVVTRVQ